MCGAEFGLREGGESEGIKGSGDNCAVEVPAAVADWEEATIAESAADVAVSREEVVWGIEGFAGCGGLLREEKDDDDCGGDFEGVGGAGGIEECEEELG